MTDVIIGADTSCYTTSLAAVDRDGKLLFQRRELLPVKAGECGLRQSDALYQHVVKLPELFRQLLSDLEGIRPYRVRGVCVSVKPRDAEDSYMPVFRAGYCFAAGLAGAYGVPLYETSHQVGHLLAGTLGSGIDFPGDFLAIHLSGGTCEMLRVEKDTLRAELIGATKDISAGQLMDRVGVRLGMPFPAGSFMEQCAAAYQGDRDIAAVPVSVRGNSVSFSGPCSALLRMAEREEEPAYIARCAYSVTARTLVKWMKNAMEQTGIRDVLIMGGVASSSILRDGIAERVEKQCRRLRVRYADAELARDNAVGVAIRGSLLVKEEQHGTAS